MARNPKYDILFTPVKIGPKTTKNRFYQVPHCNAMGYTEHHGDLHHRMMKAQGGWAVISTEQCSIHPTSCAAPYGERRLWDQGYAKQLTEWVDTLHKYEVLTAVELTHNGLGFSNRKTKEYPLGPSTNQVHYNWDPIMGKEMDKQDIKNFRRWHIDAVKRALECGFDIIYVYAGHNIALPQHFLSPKLNRRTDEYGGSVENRARLIGELLNDTKETVGDKAAVAIRLAVDELEGPDGITWQEEGQAVVEMFSDLPDLWDVNISDWANDSATSRFSAEGYQEPYISFVKQKTKKPVVSVGRFTSPDTMISQINRGIIDLIGAARPSIADPYLPKKIQEGRNEDIRECIGCNICVATENSASLFRCTQNPTAGEEWRRNWHCEEIEPCGTGGDAILVVGAGPAGMECARALGQRGYTVHLVDSRKELGGRVALEAALPGLAAWGRVRDYRQTQLGKMKNVEVHLGVTLSESDILQYGADVVVLATGSRWRRDGISHSNLHPIPGSERASVFTADDVMNGRKIDGPVVIFDDDHYYLGPVLAEKLRATGAEVTIVTPLPALSRWTEYTLEFPKVMQRIAALGIAYMGNHNMARVVESGAEVVDVYSGKSQLVHCKSVVMVSSREPNDQLFKTLSQNPEGLTQNGIKKLARIGDCVAPSTIQHAVYEGHRFARELDGPVPADVPYKVEYVSLERT